MRTRIRVAILGVAISAAVLFGGSVINHSSSPVEGASIQQPAAQAPADAPAYQGCGWWQYYPSSGRWFGLVPKPYGAPSSGVYWVNGQLYQFACG